MISEGRLGHAITSVATRIYRNCCLRRQAREIAAPLPRRKFLTLTFYDFPRHFARDVYTRVVLE